MIFFNIFSHQKMSELNNSTNVDEKINPLYIAILSIIPACLLGITVYIFSKARKQESYSYKSLAP